jgi:caudovirus prohead protease
MKIEVRADGAHISGYVNVVERKSRPVITPHGKVVEEIESRAFEQAINRAGNITVTVDHDSNHVYASTDEGTLKLYEDNIGLHADVLITDETLIDLAKKGKIKGWSFGMYNVQDEVEARAGDLPLRRIKSLDLDHVTLVVNKNPIYSATSIEIRADNEVDIETRTIADIPQITEIESEKLDTPFFDNSVFRSRVEAIKK